MQWVTLLLSQQKLETEMGVVSLADRRDFITKEIIAYVERAKASASPLVDPDVENGGKSGDATRKASKPDVGASVNAPSVHL